MDLKAELARLVHDFNNFCFHIPKAKKERDVWKFFMGWYGTIAFLWGCVFIALWNHT